MSTDLVNIARKINRQLDLGKGMFLNPDALALLAAIGVNDAIQQKAAEYLREQARMKSMRRGVVPGGGARLVPINGGALAPEQQVQPSDDRAEGLVETPEPVPYQARREGRLQAGSPAESSRESFERAHALCRRTGNGRTKRPGE